MASLTLLLTAHCSQPTNASSASIRRLSEVRQFPGTVYDPQQRVYWLADANLAGDAAMRAAMGVPGVNATGTMGYRTALRWVDALNQYNHGAGYLGHRNWQLPVTPSTDDTCAIVSGPEGNSFGPGCRRSALGGLFSTTLQGVFPEGFGTLGSSAVGPLRGLRQGLHWTAGVNRNLLTPFDADKAFTYTFLTNIRGRNTTRANFFFVLPMVEGPIGDAPPAGEGLVPYTTGPAAGLAVYDAQNDRTWPIAASLAASNHFRVDDTVTLRFPHRQITTATITAGGAMQFEDVQRWLQGMNSAGYAGSTHWTLPTQRELESLYALLGGESASSSLVATDTLAGFRNLQHFFYWSCPRDPQGDSRSPCNGGRAGPTPDNTGDMQWAFNFQSGFQGTAEDTKAFFVVPYFPAR